MTISLLISTHNTQVYVQWMPYSFVWLYLIKCVFTCLIFVNSNTKRFLSVLGVFGKVFCFYINWKISKIVLPCFGDSVTCYRRELAGRIWRLVREWKVQSWGVHRDFRGSAHDSLVSETSSREKHLAKFFKSFGLKCFGRCPGNLSQLRKTHVLHFKDSFQIVF